MSTASLYMEPPQTTIWKQEGIKKKEISGKGYSITKDKLHEGFPVSIFSKKFFLVEIDNFDPIKLPNELEELYSSIQEAKKLLELEENWDEEGGKRIKPETLFNAVSFIATYSIKINKIISEIIKPPSFDPCSDGSIDLYWTQGKLDFLINIPEAPNKVASFYGDDQDELKVKGSFNINKHNPGIFLSLINFFA